jgi:hypothetical protein
MNELKNREINSALNKLMDILAVSTDEILSPDMFTCVEEFWEYLFVFWEKKIPHFQVDYKTIGDVQSSAIINRNNYAYMYINMRKSGTKGYPVKYKSLLSIMQNKTRHFVINISAIMNVSLALFYLAPFISYYTATHPKVYADGSYVVEYKGLKVSYTHQKLVVRSVFGDSSSDYKLDHNVQAMYDELIIVANEFSAGIIATVLGDARVYLPTYIPLLTAIPIDFQHSKYNIMIQLDKKTEPVNIIREQLDKKYWPH